jgi:hypothetical protein
VSKKKEKKKKPERSHKEFRVGGFARVIRKRMPNKEIRTRMMLGPDYSVGITEMPDWKWEDGLPWAKEHLHKGRAQKYSIIAGWALIMKYVGSGDEKSPLNIMLIQRPGYKTDLDVEPGVPHRVLLGPRSILSTTKYGKRIRNKKKKGYDWWPSRKIADKLGPDEDGKARRFVETQLKVERP